MPVGVTLAEIAETAKTPADQVTEKGSSRVGASKTTAGNTGNTGNSDRR
jgi:hypothetical protein